MIPSLIVHCVNEIENRGLNEVGLYRVSGAEKDVRSLRVIFFNANYCAKDYKNVILGKIFETTWRSLFGFN